MGGAAIETRVAAIGSSDYHRQEYGQEYCYRLSIDDSDDPGATHTHDDIGHGFPCTLEELRALRAQIDAAIAGQAPLLDDEE